MAGAAEIRNQHFAILAAQQVRMVIKNKYRLTKKNVDAQKSVDE
jgi:hypothetical protein